ncbi:hypothetical protein BDZ94DRAFT_1163835, partial [Collybia nuda]
VPFGVTYEKIGTIQRRLAWPLHKDDTLSRSGRSTDLNIYFVLILLYPVCGQLDDRHRKKAVSSIHLFTFYGGGAHSTFCYKIKCKYIYDTT